MIEILLPVLLLAALFAGFGWMNRGKEGGCGCSGACHGGHDEPPVMPLRRDDGVKR